MFKRILALTLALLTILCMFAGCQKKETDEKDGKNAANNEPVGDPVTLTIGGGWEDCKAIEAVGRKFTEKYPNCTVVYEYIQDYYNNVPKRMEGEEQIDIFFTVNIQSDSTLLPYAADLKAQEGFDLSNTFDGLIENFSFREDGAVSDKLYAIPLGAEMRGMYVNKSLLNSLKIEVPDNQESLLAACETLSENGYIPFHGNPGDFSQKLLYPWVCNIIANADDPEAAYNKVNSREAGLSEMFREPFEFLYTLVEKGYYNYKKVETDLKLFTETTDEAYAKYFFNIGENGEKIDDIGTVAFMPAAMSLQSVLDKAKADYHSNIDYTFIPAPVGKDGGYAYLSPAHGIAMNKNSANAEWTVKFLDFLFQPENNKLFAEEFNIVPNTKEAFSYLNSLYDISDDRICELGQVTFDYDFYKAITSVLTDTSKGNNPKYMKTNDDGTTSLYPLDYYLSKLEESFKGNEN